MLRLIANNEQPCDKSDMRLHVRELRHRKFPGESIERFAERVGMSREHLNQLELGKVPYSARHVTMFAALFAVPEHEVLGYTHPPDAELPEATRELVHRVVQLDERGVAMVRAQVELAEQMGMVRRQE